MAKLRLVCQSRTAQDTAYQVSLLLHKPTFLFIAYAIYSSARTFTRPVVSWPTQTCTALSSAPTWKSEAVNYSSQYVWQCTYNAVPQSFIYFGKIYYHCHLLTFPCFVISVNNHTYFLQLYCSKYLKAQSFIAVNRVNKLS